MAKSKKAQDKFVMFRQGDVFVIKVSGTQRGEKISDDSGTITLALGESTGHAHQILDAGAELYNLFGGTVPTLDSDLPSPDRLLVLKNDTRLVHRNTITNGPADHDAIELPAGEYVVRIQRSYDFFGNIRNVLD